MRIGILGTGVVGATIGNKMVELNHEVMMGSRSADNDSGLKWAKAAGDHASIGTFADAAAYGELLFNCTVGSGSMAALTSAGPENVSGKVLIDVSNPLDFTNGFPPSLAMCNTDSLAEQLQRLVPDARVVKALNTMSAPVMVMPGLVPGEHNVFIAGDDAQAKETVRGLLGDIGWSGERVLDLGDISAARATEMFLPLWLKLWGVIGSPNFNVAVVRGAVDA